MPQVALSPRSKRPLILLKDSLKWWALLLTNLLALLKRPLRTLLLPWMSRFPILSRTFWPLTCLLLNQARNKSLPLESVTPVSVKKFLMPQVSLLLTTTLLLSYSVESVLTSPRLSKKSLRKISAKLNSVSVISSLARNVLLMSTDRISLLPKLLLLLNNLTRMSTPSACAWRNGSPGPSLS